MNKKPSPCGTVIQSHPPQEKADLCSTSVLSKRNAKPVLLLVDDSFTTPTCMYAQNPDVKPVKFDTRIRVSSGIPQNVNWWHQGEKKICPANCRAKPHCLFFSCHVVHLGVFGVSSSAKTPLLAHCYKTRALVGRRQEKKWTTQTLPANSFVTVFPSCIVPADVLFQRPR